MEGTFLTRIPCMNGKERCRDQRKWRCVPIFALQSPLHVLAPLASISFVLGSSCLIEPEASLFSIDRRTDQPDYSRTNRCNKCHANCGELLDSEMVLQLHLGFAVHKCKTLGSFEKPGIVQCRAYILARRDPDPSMQSVQWVRAINSHM